MAVTTLPPLAEEEIHEQLNIAIQVFCTENQIKNASTEHPIYGTKIELWKFILLEMKHLTVFWMLSKIRSKKVNMGDNSWWEHESSLEKIVDNFIKKINNKLH